MCRSVASLHCDLSRAVTGELKVNMLVRLCVQRCRLAADDVVLFGEPAFSPYVSQRSQMFFGSAFFSCLACQQLCDTQKSHVSPRNRKDFIFLFFWCGTDRTLSFKTLSYRCVWRGRGSFEFKLSSASIMALTEKVPGNCFVKKSIGVLFLSLICTQLHLCRPQIYMCFTLRSKSNFPVHAWDEPAAISLLQLPVSLWFDGSEFNSLGAVTTNL